jgi:hypothetical protein
MRFAEEGPERRVMTLMMANPASRFVVSPIARPRSHTGEPGAEPIGSTVQPAAP